MGIIFDAYTHQFVGSSDRLGLLNSYMSLLIHLKHMAPYVGLLTEAGKGSIGEKNPRALFV